MSKIYIKLMGKEIFIMKIKKPKKSRKGDYDIMVDAGKGLLFENVILGNRFREFKDIKSISWHGFYEEKNGKLLHPVLNIKRKCGLNDSIRHLGSINPEEKIPFPVCSVYISKNIDLRNLKRCNVSSESNLVVDASELFSDGSVRFDILVFGNEVDIEKFKKSEARIIFEKESVNSFNGDGTISGPESGLVHDYYNLKDNVNIILRKNSCPNDIFSSNKEDFFVVFHDPNDVYNLINRPIFTLDSYGGVVYKGNMIDSHEKRVK